MRLRRRQTSCPRLFLSRITFLVNRCFTYSLSWAPRIMAPSRNGPSRGRLADRTGCIGSIARFWEVDLHSYSQKCSTNLSLQKTYAPDYLGFALLLTAYMLVSPDVWQMFGGSFSTTQVQFLVEPFHRMFFLSNLNIQYPHALVERVPVVWNIIYAGVIPFFTLVLWLALSRASLHKWNVTILGFLIAYEFFSPFDRVWLTRLSIILTCFITDVVKNAVGRPRPDLISRCKPASGTPKDQLVTIEVCTETDHHILHDGWRSFPSGHSSFAFSGLGFLALFFCGQLHVFRPRTDLGRALIALAPILGAAMIAISRCEDYRYLHNCRSITPTNK
jgi:diacylglycerol diphosphate phosphatase/phosphatidate phosphatase